MIKKQREKQNKLRVSVSIQNRQNCAVSAGRSQSAADGALLAQSWSKASRGSTGGCRPLAATRNAEDGMEAAGANWHVGKFRSSSSLAGWETEKLNASQVSVSSWIGLQLHPR
jgi:hypothetical protein